MKNSYFAAGVIVVVAVLGFILAGKKTEAPVQAVPDSVRDSGSIVFADGSYSLDLLGSTISWEGEKLVGKKEKGIIKFKSGEFVVENGVITGGEFVIDMNSIDSTPHIDMLVEHLKSEEFFSTETYPTAKFLLKKMIPTSEEGSKVGRYVFAGDLTIKNITLPISFTANIKSQDENTLISSASFAINRADWEIKYGSPTFFNNLRDNIIRDAVIIGLDLKAQKVIQ